jgi:hypothetical protein
VTDTLVNLDYEDDWEEFIEACEQMQAQHDSGNCGDECIYCDEELSPQLSHSGPDH